jgi:uncharacterized protein YkwD
MRKVVNIISGILIIILVVIVFLTKSIMVEQERIISTQKESLNNQSVLKTEDLEKEIFSLINGVRIANNLKELKYNQTLSVASENHCKDIMQYGYWAHSREDKKFSDFVTDLDIKFEELAENLATDYYTTVGTVEGWMKSEEHKKIILGNFEEVGVGVIKKNDESLLVCSYFIK